MSVAHAPLLIGAALELPVLAQHLPWLLERDRDLEIQDFCYTEIITGDWRPLAAEIRRQLAGYKGRLGIHGPFYGFSIGSRDPDIVAVVRRRLDQGLDVAAALGATQMVIHSPFDAWDDHNVSAYPDQTTRRIGQIVDTLAPVARRAEELGVELVIENIQDRDPATRAALAAAFESPMVKVSLDTGHANFAHHACGGPSPAAFAAAAGAALAHVHLQDTGGFADNHWHPGEGNIAWGEVFAELARLPSRPRLVLEVNDLPGLRKGADFLVGLGVAA